MAEPPPPAILVVPEISVTPPPRSASPPPEPVALPGSGREAVELLVELLEGSEWAEVWRVWKECRDLILQEISDLQLQDDEVTEILNIYCRAISANNQG